MHLTGGAGGTCWATPEACSLQGADSTSKGRQQVIFRGAQSPSVA